MSFLWRPWYRALADNVTITKLNSRMSSKTSVNSEVTFDQLFALPMWIIKNCMRWTLTRFRFEVTVECWSYKLWRGKCGHLKLHRFVRFVRRLNGLGQIAVRPCWCTVDCTLVRIPGTHDFHVDYVIRSRRRQGEDFAEGESCDSGGKGFLTAGIRRSSSPGAKSSILQAG